MIINVSGDITLADASDAASYVQNMAGDEVNIIFGAMYDASKSDSCTITVIATGLEDVSGNTPVQSRMGAGQAYRQPAGHMAPNPMNQFRGNGMQPGISQGVPVQPDPRMVQGIQKPVDIRSNVAEKSLKIPDFLQRR